MVTRRRFLQVGLAGTATLLAVRVLRGPRAAPAAARRALEPAAARVVAALAPVVLAGALPSAPREREAAIVRVVDGVDRAVAGLDAPVRQDLARLLALLTF
ncbi:MAG TPA: hypothetical protein VLS49_08355, partial [Usitatibacter sp.]|nr:hypothetical protein [Usitatibacter sp.]